MNEHRWEVDDFGVRYCDLCQQDKHDAGPDCQMPEQCPTGYQILVHMERGGDALWLGPDDVWVPAPPEAVLFATGDWMNDHPRIRLTPGPGNAGVR